MFTSLEFTDFRGFRHLKLEGLQRVNLVVGRNDAGKTSLLEGLVLACEPTSFPTLPQLLRAASGNQGQRFYRWLIRDGAGKIANITLSSGNRTISIKVSWDGNSFMISPQNQGWGPCRVLSVQMHSSDEIVKSFSRAVKRAQGEEQIQKVLQRVDQRLRKVRVDVADDGSHIVVDLGLSEMLPLSQAGQGLYRLTVIMSELIGAKPALCLIDEVENGLHHSAYRDLWTGLAQAAELMDVQVVATTHSKECLDAAHRAFSERNTYDLAVVQLFRVEQGDQGRVLDRAMTEAAIAGDIDLR